MVTVEVGNVKVELSDTLRVIYALKDITGAKGLREAMQSLGVLDMDQQLQLIYAAYKAGNKEPLSEEEFIGMLLDNCGVFAIADIIEKLSEGLMYSGMTPEAAQAKKAQVAEVLKTGATSSATDTE